MKEIVSVVMIGLMGAMLAFGCLLKSEIIKYKELKEAQNEN